MGKFYLTTAIDYSDGDPHHGHAFEKIGADAIGRYRRLRGDEVHFLMGMDEHGQKVASEAVKRGVEPQRLVDEIAMRFEQMWRKLLISNDQFMRTTEASHHRGVAALIELIRRDPASRRQIVTAWNPGELERMALAPCHCLFQTQVAGGKLHLQLYQRSADLFLGVPFNLASYALLTHMLAQQCDLEVGDFIWTGGDCHLYSNHLDQVDEQLSRVPLTLPKLNITRRPPTIFDYTFEDFQIVNYQHHPAIKAPVAV